MNRRCLLMVFAAWTVFALGCSQGNWNSGDRVLVSKFLHDTELAQPKRYDVVVFKYPVRPIEKGVPKNYIKRLLGLPGQLLAILFGRLFFLEPEEGEAPLFPEPKTLTTKDGKVYKGFLRAEDDKKVVFQVYKHDRVGEAKKPRGSDRFFEQTFDKAEVASIAPIPMAERWKHRLPGPRFSGDMEAQAEMNETDLGNDFDFMVENHPWAYEWYRRGKLQIMRKPPDVMLAMRRIVYDNDFQPKDLVGERFARP